MKRKHTEKFVIVHIFASPRTVLLRTGCLHIVFSCVLSYEEIFSDNTYAQKHTKTTWFGL